MIFVTLSTFSFTDAGAPFLARGKSLVDKTLRQINAVTLLKIARQRLEDFFKNTRPALFLFWLNSVYFNRLDLPRAWRVLTDD